jgi:hypothetical protein
MFDRVLISLFGCFLGALAAISATALYGDTVIWPFVAVCSCLCGVLSFCWGAPFVDWLKEFWWRV